MNARDIATNTRDIVLETGNIYFTAGVSEKIGNSKTFAKFVLNCLMRHSRGDWGDVDSFDWVLNNIALQEGGRVLSSYKFKGGKILIITYPDAGETTVLFPDEY